MRVRWLGWAGVEIEADGAALVIDPLADPGATFAALGEEALRRVKLPAVVPPEARDAVAGLVTHLHRDHTDAARARRCTRPRRRRSRARLARRGGRRERRPRPGERRARAGGPPPTTGSRSGSEPRRVPSRSPRCRRWMASATRRSPGWSRRTGSASSTSGTRSSTATGGEWPAATGPSTWCSRRSTAPVSNFPHLQPPSPLAATLEPEQAALTGELLAARTLIPIHYDGYAIDPWYRPVDDPGPRFEAATAERPYEARMLEPGESFEPAAAAGRRLRHPLHG